MTAAKTSSAHRPGSVQLGIAGSTGKSQPPGSRKSGKAFASTLDRCGDIRHRGSVTGLIGVVQTQELLCQSRQVQAAGNVEKARRIPVGTFRHPVVPPSCLDITIQPQTGKALRHAEDDIPERTFHQFCLTGQSNNK
ncbi:hypothetical protein GDI2875 [Gluconacetobacter diazotrophicus PA1 5]|uniref:Uncharacterized protein n=1 Tax=Gluconacetobacter diazotrophicus (strain ATCC 49037 / DSM 5601 / CCUG 37298 / CIP 103539 / LMG 7603 / PAl5) TaxID=272568 RepID=A9HQZ9_GLUDA|nr:hypothetical protein GDI2875 [Gluconacetobacter diazotrophicus PA1 5]